MLYLGYVGLSMAFAFAVAALITGEVDRMWAKWMRPWVIAAWCALTCGIAVGVGGPIMNLAGVAGGLGSGRKRILDAMACSHSPAAFSHRR